MSLVNTVGADFPVHCLAHLCRDSCCLSLSLCLSVSLSPCKLMKGIEKESQIRSFTSPQMVQTHTCSKMFYGIVDVECIICVQKNIDKAGKTKQGDWKNWPPESQSLFGSGFNKPVLHTKFLYRCF